MPTATIPLTDLITDDGVPIDLSAMSEAEAIARIKTLYDFLSPAVEVEIRNGMALITLPSPKDAKMEAARAKLEQAERAALGNNYRLAVRLYEEGLRVMPDNTDARRDLAMVFYELGEFETAKKHLIRVLQLDPNDANAYLVLGNIYYQADQDYGSAERYYASALDMEPGNPYVLNSYASLKAKRNQFDEAADLFRRAIAVLPAAYPNPHYGLALCLEAMGDIDAAIDALESIFAAAPSGDARQQPVYGEARRKVLALRETRARTHEAAVMAQVRRMLDAYSAETGIPIRITENPRLTAAAKVELAWRYQRQHHQIVTKGAAPPFLLAQQFETILLSSERRAQGRSKLFATDLPTIEESVRSMERDLRKLLNRLAVSADTAADYGRRLVEGLLAQLYNAPMDMVIHSRLHGKHPWLRDHQFVWMSHELRQNLRVITDRKLRETTPLRIWEANVAMLSAAALFMDDLFSGATAFAADYAQGGLMATAQTLYASFQAQYAAYTPGDESDMVDAWAQVLKLTGQYRWLPDTDVIPAPGPEAGTGRTSPLGDEGGSTAPEFFATPLAHMAAAAYMLEALERFATMTHEQIQQVAAEIALLGITGIDYTSSDKQYTLRFLPDEAFSGLHLLCIQYVGFKLVWPEVDTKIPLEAAYASAVAMYAMKRGGQA